MDGDGAAASNGDKCDTNDTRMSRRDVVQWVMRNNLNGEYYSDKDVERRAAGVGSSGGSSGVERPRTDRRRANGGWRKRRARTVGHEEEEEEEDEAEDEDEDEDDDDNDDDGGDEYSGGRSDGRSVDVLSQGSRKGSSQESGAIEAGHPGRDGCTDRGGGRSGGGGEGGVDVPLCADTWQLAKHLGTVASNGCISSTCHGWQGPQKAHQTVLAYTQGVGANRWKEQGEEAGKKVLLMRPVFGNKRFIDWILVDAKSCGLKDILRTSPEELPGYGADVGDRDRGDGKGREGGREGGRGAEGGPRRRPAVLIRRATVHTEGGPDRRSRNGMGSDHFPISIDVEIELR